MLPNLGQRKASADNKKSFSFDSVLSTLLAFFSIFISIFFYFKADETSTNFYKSSYDIMKDVSIGDVQIVIQNLLKEGVAVRDLKSILETISLQSKINKNPSFLTEHVRQALSRNICKQNLADTGELYVITLSPDIENTIARGASPDGQSVTLDPAFTRALFEKMNIEYTVNPRIVRGLDYYTGIVFEVYVEGLGAQKQVCGGGTYNLVKLFGGEDVVSTGFALGFDRLMNAIEELNGKLELEPIVNTYVAAISDSTRHNAFNIAQTLRKAGIPTEVDLNRKKFKKILAYANKIGVKYAVLVGERDLEEGNVTIKNMETGEQGQIPVDEVATFIQNMKWWEC